MRPTIPFRSVITKYTSFPCLWPLFCADANRAAVSVNVPGYPSFRTGPALPALARPGAKRLLHSNSAADFDVRFGRCGQERRTMLQNTIPPRGWEGGEGGGARRSSLSFDQAPPQRGAHARNDEAAAGGGKKREDVMAWTLDRRQFLAGTAAASALPWAPAIAQDAGVRIGLLTV